MTRIALDLLGLFAARAMLARRSRSVARRRDLRCFLRAPRSFLSAAVAILIIAGGVALGNGAYLYGKAEVGQWLLHRAWASTQATGKPARPWPWADTQPVARLWAPAQHVDLLVLAGASGRTLAWGPAHLDNSAALGAAGNAVVSAHRDTHFRFLARVAIGDPIIVERADGARTTYRVREIAIVDARNLALSRDSDYPTLTLVTCYPFDAIVPGGPLRFMVIAEAEASEGPPQGPDLTGDVDGKPRIPWMSEPLIV